MNNEKIIQNLKNFRLATYDEDIEVQGISFKYKTVQFHLLDDLFEEIKKKGEYFGDVKIYSEKFSLPGFGRQTNDLDKNEFQFEIIVSIGSTTNSDTYYDELKKCFDKTEKKHGVEIFAEPYEPTDEEDAKDFGYNVHRIVFHTKDKDIFPEE